MAKSTRNASGAEAEAPKAPRITRLRLENWRNFRKVDLTLGRRAFVVGPNAAGKTNLLDALRFLRDIAKPGGSLVSAVHDRRGVSHLRSLHAGGSSSIGVSVSMTLPGSDEPWTYSLVLSGSETRNRPLRIERETVAHAGRTLFTRPGASDRNDERLLTQTYLEQTSQNREFRGLADGLASIAHVHVVPQVAKSGRAEDLADKDAPGSDFIEQIARLAPSKQRAELKRMENLLQPALPRFSKLKCERDPVGRPHLLANYSHWRRGGAWQNEQEFSDGTLRLLGLFWAILRGSSPLLLEEPELSLHLDVAKQLPRLLYRATVRSGRQVIVSSHAEEILSDKGIDPSEVILLEPSDNETKVVLGTHRPELLRAAKARTPLGPVVRSLTRPRDIDQLSFAF